MRVELQYGTGTLPLDLPAGAKATVLSPRFLPGLPDEAAAFGESVRNPVESPPLRDIVKPEHRVAIAIPDLTRPFPTARVLPWLFKELSHVPANRFTIINGTGSHRINTNEELEEMVGRSILGNYRVVNHDSRDPKTVATAGMAPDGWTVKLRKEWIEADRRISLGFIEPHFMAGFSGGYKGVFPAIADLDSIMHYHRAEVIGHPKSTWGILDGNPTQGTVQAYGSLSPAHFLVNVTLNKDRQITRFFCGTVLPAFKQGCAFAKETAMVKVEKHFPIVVTTNSGYPLDQNLYQTVKGMSAASQIVEQDGLILAAARCNDGFPEHGNFKRLLFEAKSPKELLDTIMAPGFSVYDQWEAQLLAIIRLRAGVGLKSELKDEEVRKAHLEPVADLSARLADELKRRGPDTQIAILPEGPMTIPYVG